MSETKTIKSKETKPHFYNGNIKIGDMLSFNKLAGNRKFNGCMGSCGKYCTGCWDSKDWKKSPCYVAKSYYQRGDAVINSHIVNTLAMRNNPDETSKELCSQLKRKRTNKTVRIHASGELESIKELEDWIWIAQEVPERIFYIYTKAYDIVDSVLTKNNKLPKNIFINISIWHENGLELYNKWKSLDNIRAFVYDDSKTSGYKYPATLTKKSVYCPAYKEDKDTGRVKLSHDLTCDKCGLCFKNTNKVVMCLSH